MIRKTIDLLWGLNLGVHTCQKNSSYFKIGRVYMLHRGTCALLSNHDYTHRYQGFCGSYTFRFYIGLKIIFRLACATCEGNTKFGIFRGWFATF